MTRAIKKARRPSPVNLPVQGPGRRSHIVVDHPSMSSLGIWLQFDSNDTFIPRYQCRFVASDVDSGCPFEARAPEVDGKPRTDRLSKNHVRYFRKMGICLKNPTPICSVSGG